MAKVTLLGEHSINPVEMASHAGRACYESDMPSIGDGKMIDVKNRLFVPGHHTTLEHAPHHFTFAMEDISISTITFGFHLSHPFYNSDQRSGRFSKMYENPDMGEIESRIHKYFPNENPSDALKFIESGIKIFQANKDNLTDIAAETLRAERPFVSDKYIEQNAKKMAQEQLRVFISTIAPTAMDHTINIVTLAALWRTAHTPEMRDTVAQMVAAVRSKYPETEHMFDKSVAAKPENDWAPTAYKFKLDDGKVRTSPELKLRNIDIYDCIVNPNARDTVDVLKFTPETMTNNLSSIRVDAEMSIMTMGQDQRHRTIERGEPIFTGDFYLPPLLAKAGLITPAEKFRNDFWNLPNPMHLRTMIAPYGMMMHYGKRINLNALLHEQAKRLCWCAQEEIYNLNIQLMQQLGAKGHHDIVTEMMPHCAKYGKCCEGARFCGRDMSVWKNGNDGFKVRGI
ncbi:MAG: FAD-dependent thymidylate synthase [Alphaproteobacteria bacterium]|nr:FAD-dependent thymidylate synthase [Alphaproteobacteria bacterium]